MSVKKITTEVDIFEILVEPMATVIATDNAVTWGYVYVLRATRWWNTRNTCARENRNRRGAGERNNERVFFK